MVEWEKYAQFEPFGFELANLIQAKLAMAVVSQYSDKKFKLSDFMFDFAGDLQISDPEQIMLYFKGIAQRHGDNSKT